MQQLKATSLANLCVPASALLEPEHRDSATSRQGKFSPSPNLFIHPRQMPQILLALLGKNLVEIARQFFSARDSNPFFTPAGLTRIARLGRSAVLIGKSKPVPAGKRPTGSKPVHSLPPDRVDPENHARLEVAETDRFPLVKESAPPASFFVEQSPSPAFGEEGNGACKGSGIGGRCVLCVGGRAVLYPEYRRVVEASGGKLVIYRNLPQEPGHHLPVLLDQADMVVCPLDCVNHTAFFTVKRYCRRSGKPCVLLDRSNLSTFCKGIATLAGLYTSPAPARSDQSKRRCPASPEEGQFKDY
ncbi:DUF2325 domain-containing protein [Nitrosospira multiformis]|uniref:DUF2325 domain-containing protein n=1 Tax=Nitrosospira multiformis (strain ATCC 25196 / NCIMB 11849 / C 71) TaxID=323848 RepID=Q2Y6D7_NITMU|nr:DUF2325 domain-containing protein [Nitrosospira multiformis]ABB75684.1 hypothetical protein Nmul_A2395 [Nitrosospira multiformis ATCC 25196]